MIDDLDLEEEVSLPLADDVAHYRLLEFACELLCVIQRDIPEKDLEHNTITLSALKAYEIADALTLYAEIYEDVNIEDMMTMAEVTSNTPVSCKSDVIN